MATMADVNSTTRHITTRRKNLLLRRTIPCCVIFFCLRTTRFSIKKTENTVSRVLSPDYDIRHGHLSRIQISLYLQQPTRSCEGKPSYRNCNYCLALLQMRLAMRHPLPSARWALTPPFHPYLGNQGGLFSVALAVMAPSPVPCPVVNRHLFRRSPDFPLSPQPF